MNIYIGDGSKIMNRIRNQHCSGNVEGSSLRKHIANALGFQFMRVQRANGSWRVRLNLPNPIIGEQQITNYLRSGHWKYIICPTGIEAKDFQFYAIQNIIPATLLNINQGQWDATKQNVYQGLLNQLINCNLYDYNQTIQIPNQPGVYLFVHNNEPN